MGTSEIITDFQGWQSGWLLPDRRPAWEWMKENEKLPPVYVEPGPFDATKSRYMLPVFEALCDEKVRQVDILKGIQTGGSLVWESMVPWIAINRPGPVMITMQSDDDMKKHAKTRLHQLFMACPPMAAMLKRLSSTDYNQLEIYFGNFFILMNGANLASLQSTSVMWKINDEVWAWKPGMLNEAKGRVSAFEERHLSKILNVSQAGTEGDDWSKEWESSSQEMWSVPCPKCKKVHPLEFSVTRSDGSKACVVWDEKAKKKDGTWNVARAAETARYECPNCGHPVDNSNRTRKMWNDLGEYVARNPEAPKSHRGMRWNSLVKRDLGLMVAEFLEADALAKKGIFDPLRQFFQKRLTIFWKEQNTGEAITISTSGYSKKDFFEGEKIEDEQYRFLVADRQLDHFHVVCRAFNSRGGSKLVYESEGQKVPTVEAVRDLQLRLGVVDRLTFMDAQYDTPTAYRDCAKYGWTALHGDDSKWFSHHKKVAGKMRSIKRFFSPFAKASTVEGPVVYVRWSNLQVKDVLANLVKGKGVDWEIPEDASTTYIESITESEYKREYAPGKWRWEPTSGVKGKNNHFWDCECMVIVAAMLCGAMASPEESESVDEGKTK